MADFVSTNEVSARQRLTYWNDLVCHAFPRVEVTSLLDGPFFGSISTEQVGFIKLAEVATGPSIVRRSKSLLDPAGEDYVKVIYQIHGETIVYQEDRTAFLSCGDWVFLDCMQTYSLEHTPAHHKNVVLVLQLPKRIFCTRLPNPETLTGYTINSHVGLGRVTYDFIQSLRRDIAHIAPETKTQLAETLVDLLATNLRETLYPARGTPRNQAVMLLEVKSFIHQHLADPSLSASMIARALNISKSYLYLLFQGENTTLDRYIWDLRLEKCRADLANPLNGHRTITEIAFGWGFNNSTHFSRLFKERYGLSARSYRHY
jgi:AraC-like DNA-binding protein